MSISVIKKRDGRIAPFDIQKITNAILRAFRASGDGRDYNRTATELALEVWSMLELAGNPAPTVEQVQDVVEQVLMKEGYTQTAKAYILYRQERTRMRHLREQETDPDRIGTVSLEEALHSCNTVWDGVFAAYNTLRESGLTVVTAEDFAAAMAPSAAGGFLRSYKRTLRYALELKTGIFPAESAIAACQSGLAISLLHDKAAYAKEADRLCGTMGFDRDAVESAQEFAYRHAVEETKGNIRDGTRRLKEALNKPDFHADLLPGPAHSPEAQLIAECLKEE